MKKKLEARKHTDAEKIARLAALLLALVLPVAALADAPSAAPAWDWTPVLQALGSALATILATVLVVLTRAGLRYLDARTGWHLEERYMAVAQRRILALEQTARKQIQADLEDGKITAEEARAMVRALGRQAAEGLMQELGIGRGKAQELVEAAVISTGAARSTATRAEPKADPTTAPSAG